MGMALHSCSESLLEAWDEWSRQSSKYKKGECRRQWSSFNKNGGVSLGTLHQMVKEDTRAKLKKKLSKPGTCPATHGGLDPAYDSARRTVVDRVKRELRPGCKLVEEYHYHDETGSHIQSQLRFSSSSGKTFRPLVRRGNSWHSGSIKAGAPLYSLPELIASPGRLVYVTEGEKDVESLRDLGLLATTSHGGAQSAKKSDWAPLAGRRVVILPDNDAAGRRYADTVESLLKSLDPAPRIAVLELPDLAEKGDCSDFIRARLDRGASTTEIREEIESLVDHAPHPEQPQQATSYRPFPLHVLPEPARAFVVEAAASVPCDPAFVALPLLAALGAAVGTSRAVRLKRDWTEPCMLWTLVVARSGTAKSPALKLAMKEPDRRQAVAQKQYHEALKSYTAKLEKRGGRNGKPRKRISLDEDEPAPEKPTLRQEVVDDTTVEALCVTLEENPRGVLLARDELSGWLNSFNQYKAGRGADEAHWLSIHSGRPLRVSRKTGNHQVIAVPRAFVCITGGIQTRVLRRLLDDEYRASGLAARLLMAMPPETPRQWSDREVSKSAHDRLRLLFEALHELEGQTDADGLPSPITVRLTPRAKRIWIEFVNENGQEQAQELDEDLVSAWSKLEGYAARFALLFHLIRSATGDESLLRVDRIDPRSIKAGIELSRWFGSEARRIYATLNLTAEEEELRIMQERIRMAGGTVSIRDWQRKLSKKTTEEAEAELQALVDAGLGTIRTSRPGPKGGRPSRCFVLNEALSGDETSSTDPAKEVLSVSGDPRRSRRGRRKVARKRSSKRSTNPTRTTGKCASGEKGQ